MTAFKKKGEFKPRALTPEAVAYITALAAEHSAGLEERCARYRRRAAVLRTAAAACLLVLFVTNVNNAFASVPRYEKTYSSIKSDGASICQTIDTLLICQQTARAAFVL